MTYGKNVSNVVGARRGIEAQIKTAQLIQECEERGKRLHEQALELSSQFNRLAEPESRERFWAREDINFFIDHQQLHNLIAKLEYAIRQELKAVQS